MKRKDSFMLGSFNICSAHFQEKRYTDKNLRLIAGKIRESGADVVALQEVDRRRRIRDCHPVPLPHP